MPAPQQDMDVPAPQESSVEDRLTSFFGGAKPPKPEPTPPAPVSADAPAEEEAQPPEDQASDEPPAEDTPDDGLVELEHLDTKWRVPPDLAKAFESNRAMATKAAMDLAPIRKALEVEKLALNASKAFESEISSIVQEQEKYTQLIDYANSLTYAHLQSMSEEERFNLDKAVREASRKLPELKSQLDGKRGEHRQKFEHMVAQAVAETERYMGSKVPNWSADAGKALSEYGQSYGIPPEKLAAGWFADPLATHIMWKAQQWDKLQSSKPSVQNKASTAPPVSKPGSSDMQNAMRQNNYQKARQKLSKSGSLEDFASAYLASQSRK